MTRRIAIGGVAVCAAIWAGGLTLAACGDTDYDESPHAHCEQDATDKTVVDDYCLEGLDDYEWEYDAPEYDPMLVPYFIDDGHGTTRTVYRTPAPGYKPPAGYKPPSAPAYKPPPAQAPVARNPPPAPVYKPPPPAPPAPKAGK